LLLKLVAPPLQQAQLSWLVGCSGPHATATPNVTSHTSSSQQTGWRCGLMGTQQGMGSSHAMWQRIFPAAAVGWQHPQPAAHVQLHMLVTKHSPPSSPASAARSPLLAMPRPAA
jgi:hypothetical protein